MDTLELKSKIEELFSDFEELKVRAKQVDNQLKPEWDQSLQNLEETKDTLLETYEKITKASEATARELSQKFDALSKSAEQRIEHLREMYSKTLN